MLMCEVIRSGCRPARWREVRLSHSSAVHFESGGRSTLITADSHLIAPAAQSEEQSGERDTFGRTSFSNGHVGAVPCVALNSNLYFETGERAWRVHDGGADIPPDIEHDAPLLTGIKRMTVLHDYDGTDTGVAEGLE